MKHNQLLSLLLCAALLFLAVPFGVLAEGSANDFSYYLDKEDCASIADYVGDGGDVVIPSTIDGYPVTAIEVKAFSNDRKITSVLIPEGVTYICSYAFAGCTELHSISLPSTLEEISESAFADCTSLTEVTIPKNVWIVGPYIFMGCTSLAVINCEANAPTDYWYHEWADKCSAEVLWAQAPLYGDCNGDGIVNLSA